MATKANSLLDGHAGFVLAACINKCQATLDFSLNIGE
jgi:hypothetical protein